MVRHGHAHYLVREAVRELKAEYGLVLAGPFDDGAA